MMPPIFGVYLGSRFGSMQAIIYPDEFRRFSIHIVVVWAPDVNQELFFTYMSYHSC